MGGLSGVDRVGFRVGDLLLSVGDDALRHALNNAHHHIELVGVQPWTRQDRGARRQDVRRDRTQPL